MAVKSIPSLMGVSKKPYASFAGKTGTTGRIGGFDDLSTIDDIITAAVWVLVFLRGLIR